MGSRIPDWIKSWIPQNLLQIEEQAWNAYPICKTIYANKFMGDKFSIIIKSAYLPDDGTTENALGLSPEQLEQRVVDRIDIASDPIDQTKYKPEEDPSLFVSKKTGRGKLQKGWQQEALKNGTIMCSYKVIVLELNSWMFAPLLSRVESWVHQSVFRSILTLGHRQAFTWMDEWHGMTIEDVRNIEAETKKILDERLAETKTKESEAAPAPANEVPQQQPENSGVADNGQSKGWLSGWW